jgi:hypothetical protein
MLMNARPSLSLPEWTVLTVLSQQPAHGFAVAQLTARHGELGRRSPPSYELAEARTAHQKLTI